MQYTSRGMRRRGDSDKWEVVLSHKDPYTGETVPTYHTVEARIEKQTQKKRDQLIVDLEREGGRSARPSTSGISSTASSR